MIQEKDFLYRVPVKTAPITTPGGQIRNPEILVDVEGGEFMHGNILDANSTNKLINQSVKDAVDNKLTESGYVTQDLLEAETTRATEQENSLKTLIGAETSARTKGDEDLSSKIKAEQTRAEGKEKEISDKLAIVNGDSNTEGSFRKAIADVVAAAPEDLDTLKEIADKLAGNDDLHTALNQAITEKADASALLNEVTRATGAESGLQAAIATKADATALEGAKTEFDEKINNLKFIPYNSTWNDSYSVQHYTLPDRKGIDLSAYTVSTKLFGDAIEIANESESLSLSRNSMDIDSSGRFYVDVNSIAQMILSESNSIISAEINDKPVIEIKDATGTKNKILKLNADGITLPNGDDNHVLTSNAGIIDITQYALKSELPTVPTKTSQLTNDSNFITAADVDFTPYATTQALTAVEQKVAANTTAIEDKQDAGYYVTYIRDDGSKYTLQKGFDVSNGTDNVAIDESGVDINIAGNSITLDDAGIMGNDGGNNHYSINWNCIKLSSMNTEIIISPIGISSADDEDTNLFNIDSTAIILGPTNNPNVKISEEGIKFKGRAASDIPVAGGEFVKMNSFVLAPEYNSKIKSLEARIAALEAKLPEAAA